MSLTLMSLHGGILIGVILLLRAFCENRLPRTTFLILWGVALLRLLVPFPIQTQFSIYSLVGWQTVWENSAGDLGAVIDSGWLQIMENPLMPYSEDISAHPPCSDMDTSAVIAIVRWGGTLLCALLFFALYQICARRFRCSLPVQNEYVRRWVSGHRLRRPVSARQSDRATTPLTYGILKPVILLPRELEQLEEEKMEYILQHEYRHICRFDGIWKFLMIPAVCLHWFNPMVWIMYFMLSRDIELACDESVLRHFGVAAKKPYARLLLEMSEEKQLYKPLYNAFGRDATDERIRAIMTYKKKTFVTILAAIMMVMMVACGFATSEQPDGTDRDSVYNSGLNENNPEGTISKEQSAETLLNNGNADNAAKTDQADPENDNTKSIYIYGTSDTIAPSQSIIIYRLQDSEDDISVWTRQTGQDEPYEIRILEMETE